MIKDLKEALSGNFLVTESVMSDDLMTIRPVSIMDSNLSLNGRVYSAAAMREMHEKSQAAKVFLDHPNSQEMKNGCARSIRDFAGMITNTELNGSKLSGSFQGVKRHWSLFSDIYRMRPRPHVGFSINARVLMRGRNEKGLEIVESVKTLHSIDLVSVPAMVKSLTEHFSGLTGDNMEEDLREFLASLGKETIHSFSEQEINKFIDDIRSNVRYFDGYLH